MRAILICVLGMMSSQWAQADAKSDISYRQGMMSVVGGHMKSMGTILKGRVHASDLAYHANAMQAVSILMPSVFPEGSGKGKTKAKSDIWDEPEAFKQSMDDYVAAAKGMATAVATNDMALVGPAIKQLGGTCKGCHDDYKQKD
ncbi:MAG: cytochrome c556 [Candidatus Azotimanducaceae bacterium]|jgi:cytochrome c556